MNKIGIADTMFARVNMYEHVIQSIHDSKEKVEIERYTVPGVKDLPVACKILFEKFNCDIVIALGMPGPMPIDKQCSHEASLGIQMVQLMADKHILEVFVHLDEGDEKDIREIAKRRAYDHAKNALALLKGKDSLSHLAGKGVRQGKESVGEIR